MMKLSVSAIACRTALAAALLAVSAIAASPAQAQSTGPTYSWKKVKVGGGGFVPGMIAHPLQRGLFYAKTDVLGAYRYNAATSTWIPLNDWTPPEKSHRYGIDTIAIDPSNVNKFYLIAGFAFDSGNAVFMSSQDQGRSFKQVPLPFSAGANSKARHMGERLQVDPNLGNVLYYGTANSPVNASNNGLWKSTTGGDTWNKVPSFPALSSDGTGGGVAFLAFHKGSNWNKPAGSPTSVIYVNRLAGPDGDGPGYLYKYSGINGGTWTLLSSTTSGGYGGVSVHGVGPTTRIAVAVTNTWSDFVGQKITQLSDNAGSTWREIESQMPHTQTASGYWGWNDDVEIDPNNRDHIMHVDGPGVWETMNASSATPSWTVKVNGIEETVGFVSR